MKRQVKTELAAIMRDWTETNDLAEQYASAAQWNLSLLLARPDDVVTKLAAKEFQEQSRFYYEASKSHRYCYGFIRHIFYGEPKMEW